MRKKISLLRKITEYLFGKKFYICVVNSVGSPNYFVNSKLMRSMDEVNKYKKEIDKLESVNFIGYYSFRSHDDFRLTSANSCRVPEDEV